MWNPCIDLSLGGQAQVSVFDCVCVCACVNVRERVCLDECVLMYSVQLIRNIV
jgi:hypothetical protein